MGSVVEGDVLAKPSVTLPPGTTLVIVSCCRLARRISNSGRYLQDQDSRRGIDDLRRTRCNERGAPTSETLSSQRARISGCRSTEG